MTAAPDRRRFLTLLAVASLTPTAVSAQPSPSGPSVRTGSRVHVVFEPARPQAGDVALVRVRGAAASAAVEILVDGRPLGVFKTADGHTALLGIDMDAPAAALAWHVTVTAADGVTTAEGRLSVAERAYSVQHLTVARRMVELDPETERRAVEETARLQAVYRAVSGERWWRGRFIRPVSGEEPGTGFGARRVINGHPRAPHAGIDFPAATGTPVVAANHGRVALVGEFFFPGRLVIIDHGLGLHTAYFHLDTIAVTEGQRVTRGMLLGTVGMTGRVTGPHLHFGAQVGTARIDPAVLLGLAAGESD